ncbi:MAG: HAMP domain-containing protein, partial [Bacillota bacterium]|nr:HAMP domain-containing protein [Bacillota bacterium]
MRRFWNLIQEKMNNYNVRKKLMILYVFCVLLPLFVTDSVILTILLQAEKREQSLQMESIASAVQFDISSTIEGAVSRSKYIYVSRKVNEFLNREYASGYDFFEASQELISDSLYEPIYGSGTVNMVMYADNETIINGGHFYRLSSVMGEEWYEKLKETGQDMILHFYYVGNNDPATSIKRRISLVRKLNYYKDSEREKLVRLDLDYSNLVRKLSNMNYGMPVYVCIGDKILFSNDGHNSLTQDYEYLTGKEKIGYEMDWSIYGEDIRILVMKSPNTIMVQIWQHFPLILFMLAVNILLPWLLTYIINNSFTSRLRELSQAFDEVEAESLKEIEDVRGQDEIGSLMRNYNR